VVNKGSKKQPQKSIKEKRAEKKEKKLLKLQAARLEINAATPRNAPPGLQNLAVSFQGLFCTHRVFPFCFDCRGSRSA
jgi:hypothetical protein